VNRRWFLRKLGAGSAAAVAALSAEPTFGVNAEGEESVSVPIIISKAEVIAAGNGRIHRLLQQKVEASAIAINLALQMADKGWIYKDDYNRLQVTKS